MSGGGPTREREYRRALLAIFLLTGAISLSAQRVTPALAVHKGGKTKSRFELTNKTLRPASVVIEAQSFSVSEEGTLLTRPLDAHIRVKLSSMTLRIPPQQSRFVFYEAKADQLPAWFMIYSTFGRKPDQKALNLQFRLAHTVYLMQKDSLKKEDVSVAEVRYAPEEKQVVVVLENHSPRLGRVLEAVVSFGGKKKKLGNFPMFPEYRRRFTFPWKCARGTGVVRFTFKKFEIKRRFEAGQDAGEDGCDDG